MNAAENFQVTVHVGEPVETRDYAVLYAFDDLSIPATHNLRLNMSRLEKYEQNPILERGVEGGPDSYRADGVAVLREGNRWRMWYQAKAGEDSHVSYRMPKAEFQRGRVIKLNAYTRNGPVFPIR